MKYQLPDIKKSPVLPEYFPTLMQAFIFRNWETVSKSRLAEVLGTTAENVETVINGALAFAETQEETYIPVKEYNKATATISQ